MLGTNPDAIEAWAFDAEHVRGAARSAWSRYRRVVLLSGDVHYTASTRDELLGRVSHDPARLVQFTSSGFKNVMPSYISAIDRSLGFAQQLCGPASASSASAGTSRRTSWSSCRRGEPRPTWCRRCAARLRETPVLIPTWGWPDENEGDADDPAKKSRLNAGRAARLALARQGAGRRAQGLGSPEARAATPIDVAAIDALLNDERDQCRGGGARRRGHIWSSRHATRTRSRRRRTRGRSSSAATSAWCASSATAASSSPCMR